MCANFSPPKNDIVTNWRLSLAVVSLAGWSFFSIIEHRNRLAHVGEATAGFAPSGKEPTCTGTGVDAIRHRIGARDTGTGLASNLGCLW